MQDERLCSVYLAENWVPFESNVTCTFCLQPAVVIKQSLIFKRLWSCLILLFSFATEIVKERVWVNQDPFETIFSCDFVNSLCYDFEKQNTFLILHS